MRDAAAGARHESPCGYPERGGWDWGTCWGRASLPLKCYKFNLGMKVGFDQ